jgi:hypothetical protein
MDDWTTMPALRPEVAEAIRVAKENMPPYPTELCHELGAYIDDGSSKFWKQGKPCFGGWIWVVSGCQNGLIPNNVSVSLEEGYLPHGDFDPSDIGYQAFWKGRVNSKTKPIIWCAIPSLLHGRSDPGGTVTVGEDKIRIGYSRTELDTVLRAGWRIMTEMIEEHGEFVPEEG